MGDGTPRAMLAETMKIPDPIIEPATSIVASVRVIAFTNPGVAPVPASGTASVVTAELLMQDAGTGEGAGTRKRREGVAGECPRRT
jgi:hypothetical protein